MLFVVLCGPAHHLTFLFDSRVILHAVRRRVRNVFPRRDVQWRACSSVEPSVSPTRTTTTLFFTKLLTRGVRYAPPNTLKDITNNIRFATTTKFHQTIGLHSFPTTYFTSTIKRYFYLFRFRKHKNTPTFYLFHSSYIY